MERVRRGDGESTKGGRGGEWEGGGGGNWDGGELWTPIHDLVGQS